MFATDWAWRSCSSLRRSVSSAARRSVTSVPTETTKRAGPAPSTSIVSVQSMSRRRPSRACHSLVWWRTSPAANVAIAASKASRPAWGPMPPGCQVSQGQRPRTSAARQPLSRSASALKRTMRPCSSSTSTSMPALPITASTKFLSRSSAARAATSALRSMKLSIIDAGRPSPP